MKKFFSILLVACMIIGTMAITVSAAPPPVPAIVNNNTYIPTPVEVPKFTTPPTFDGVITTEEWVGEPSIKFGPATAAIAGINEKGIPHPQRGESVTADNSFFDPYYSTLVEEEYNKMYTEVWFRYDANNMYIAAKVHDVTGQCNKQAFSMDDIWNGDNIEITFDPEGPNSGMISGVPGFEGDPNYDWTTTPFNQEIFNHFRVNNNVNNNYRQCWIRDFDKKNDFVFARDFVDGLDYGFNTKSGNELYDNIKITVDENDDGSCIINYEIYIPWAEIFRSYGSAADAVPGKVFGAVFSVTEAYDMSKAGGWRYYDSCYSWGGGHFGGWAQDAPNSAGGTNAVILSAETLTPFEAPVPGGGNEGGNEGSGNEGSGNEGTVNPPAPPVIEEGGDKIEVDKDDIVEEPTTEGNTATTTKTYKIPVASKLDYKTATELSYTFSFDTEKFEFNGIIGLDEADYKLETNADGSYKLTIVNIDKVKAAKTGDKLFEISVKSKDDASIDDINLDIKDDYKKVTNAPTSNTGTTTKPTSPNTGDNIAVVAAIAVVSLAVFAVATKKRRFN